MVDELVDLRLADLESAWCTGDTIANHPRVRTVWINDRHVSLHRYAGVVPAGIEFLSGEPDRAAVAGLLAHVPGYYAMAYREGDVLQGASSAESVGSTLTTAMLRLWSCTDDGAPVARREQPVLGPITVAQFVSMPDAVLTAACQYAAAVRPLQEVLDHRSPARRVIHGDLKADNIVVDDEGQVHFIDWECAGAGHPEDDLASLFASLCTYAVARAVRSTLAATASATAPTLASAVSHELRSVQDFSAGMLRLVAPAPIGLDHLGHAFLVSLMCRLQGLQFVPSGESVRLALSEFVSRSLSLGPASVDRWLRGADEPERGPSR